jgi:hypothetical protein
LGWKNTESESGINPVWREKKTEDPEGSFFLPGVARGAFQSPQRVLEERFEGGELVWPLFIEKTPPGAP